MSKGGRKRKGNSVDPRKAAAGKGVVIPFTCGACGTSYDGGLMQKLTTNEFGQLSVRLERGPAVPCPNCGSFLIADSETQTDWEIAEDAAGNLVGLSLDALRQIQATLDELAKEAIALSDIADSGEPQGKFWASLKRPARMEIYTVIAILAPIVATLITNAVNTQQENIIEHQQELISQLLQQARESKQAPPPTQTAPPLPPSQQSEQDSTPTSTPAEQ